MSIRLGLSVEGQTEERFAKDILSEHLAGFGVRVTPVIVATSRSASGKKTKGGGISIGQVTNELRSLLHGFSGGFVTTLYDFYGFEDKAPKETVDHLEERIAEALHNPSSFIPYVQRHEFEALLLSHPPTAASYFGAPALESLIAVAVASAGSPENVNDRYETAPSGRLEKWTAEHAPPAQQYSGKTKVLHGPQLAKRLTLPVIRAACPRFNDWLTRLERLPGDTPPQPQSLSNPRR